MGGSNPSGTTSQGVIMFQKNVLNNKKKNRFWRFFFIFDFLRPIFFFTQNESRLDLKIQALLYRVLLYGMLPPKIPENQGKMDRPIWCLRAPPRHPPPPIRYSMMVWGCLNVFLAI